MTLPARLHALCRRLVGRPLRVCDHCGKPVTGGYYHDMGPREGATRYWHPGCRDVVEAAKRQTLAEDAWGSVWLHGKWSWLTKNMTTPEREYAADCVARWSTRLNADDGEPDDELEGLQWWRKA